MFLKMLNLRDFADILNFPSHMGFFSSYKFFLHDNASDFNFNFGISLDNKTYCSGDLHRVNYFKVT
jgi:hypothetical protein